MELRQWIATDHASVLARFESAIVAHVPDTRWKTSVDPDGDGPAAGSSIAFLLFHITYHQDLALNTAIRNHAPLFDEHRNSLGLGEAAPGAGLAETENRAVTSRLQLPHLRAYASAVARRTSEWLADVPLLAFETIPEASYRLEHLAGIPPDGELSWLHDMWRGKPVSWFVQWECVGHGVNHVGEMISIRNRMGLSPF